MSPEEAAKLMRDAGAIPLEPFTRTDARWKCQCAECGKTIYPALNSVKSQGTHPCRFCAALQMGARRRQEAEKKHLALLRKAKLEPLEPFPGVNKPWKCKCIRCGKIVSPHLSSVKRGSSCGYCAGKRVDEADLREIFLKNGFEPIGSFPGWKRNWKSKHIQCGRVVAPDYGKVKMGRGCAYCAGNKRITPEEARELFLSNQLEPIEPFKNSQVPWKSRCLITGKVVSPTYGKVRDFGHRCKYCSRSVLDGAEAIEVMRAGGFEPLTEFPGTGKPWKSKCKKCSRVVSPTYTNVRKGHGCTFCMGHTVPDEIALESLQTRGYTALENFPGSAKPWKVQCLTCGRVQLIKLHSSNVQTKCAYCAGAKLDVEEALLLLKRLHFEPLEDFTSARHPWKMKCLKCGHVVSPTWTHLKGRALTSKGRGCGYCAGTRVDVTAAEGLMKELGLKPLVKFPGSNNPWKSQCMKCGTEVRPRYSDLRSGQGGCSNCADYGLNYSDKGYIYVITHEEMRAHKVGIANSYKSRAYDDRMYKHQKAGWKFYKKKEFKTLQQAYAVEQKVIQWLREEVGLSFHLSSTQMPQGGWTETVDSDEIDCATIWKKIEEIRLVTNETH